VSDSLPLEAAPSVRDPDITVRSLRGRAIIAVAACAALFHLYAAGVSPFTALVQRPVHMALMAALGFLGVGIRAAGSSREREPRRRVGSLISWFLGTTLVASCVYLVTQHEVLVLRSGSPTPVDLVAGVVTILVILELARRFNGWGLVAVCVLALAYAVSGPYLPGLLAHRGYGLTRLVEHLYLSTEGIWGIPLGVSADFVFLFVLFGALLDVAGGGALLISLADRVAGKTRGGPAKTAAVSSAFMGSLSGSAVANVVTTGTFTIPLMKRSGFKPYFAGAIEAAASTGGQLMPPIMGAGAFVLATWTSIPYTTVALAAAVPAALYYVALLMAIHFQAGKTGLEPSGGVGREPVLARIHLLTPLLVIIGVLVLGRSPMRAAFWGVISAWAVTWLRKDTRLSAESLKKGLESGARGSVQVAVACAAAGIVVGVASLTGIGLRMSELIVTLSGGNLLGALGLTAIGSIVLGMGLPTTAAYVVLAALGAPALTQLGVPLLSAHLFIFYFGCISNVTPPVSLAAYAAAGIADSPAMKTAVTAMMLSGAGFIVPFMFVYVPALLLQGTWYGIALAFGTACAGVTALAAAGVGFGRRALTPIERVVLAAGAFGLMLPGLATDGFGMLALAVIVSRK
jgi:TRAP transporter 4TM/12TM fusion protein